ncbi:MAG: nitrilase-related carbon-nitrogen hydrolase [Planctomycetota bacterium]
MRVACLQFDIAWEDKPANFARVRKLLGRSRIPRGSLVILPEMFATGFSMNVARTAERTGGETEQFLAEAARESGVFLLGGLVRTAPGGRGRNEAVGFDPRGRRIARYAKRHLFARGGETERRHVPGRRTVTFRWGDFMVAPVICYDLRFPETCRAAVRRGADLLIVIANWPAARADVWRTLLRARAIENQAYVAGVNRLGCDPKETYDGGSLLIGPKGDILADGGRKEGMISAEFRPAEIRTWRREFPALIPDSIE